MSYWSYQNPIPFSNKTSLLIRPVLDDVQLPRGVVVSVTPHDASVGQPRLQFEPIVRLVPVRVGPVTVELADLFSDRHVPNLGRRPEGVLRVAEGGQVLAEERG